MITITINNGMSDEKSYNIVETTTGSEKQIAWADKIKAGKISDLFSLLSQPGMAQKEKEILEYCDAMNAIAEAKYWIDNREKTWKEIAKEIKK